MDTISDWVGALVALTMIWLGYQVARMALREHVDDLRSGRIAQRANPPLDP